MTWTTLRLQITTPLFNAGAGPTGQPEVRVPSLRGAMRFWFRALVGGVIGPNLELLAKLEHTVFGNTAACCPVPMRIPNPPPQRPADTSWLQGGIRYLLGQGLGDLGKATTIRPYVAPGPDVEFDLELRLDRADNVDAAAATLASLWLLCAYGGIGARTRRGFGGVRIIGEEGWLPPPWTTESILSPNLNHYEKRRYLWPDETLGKCLPPLLKGRTTHPQHAWEVAPTFPVLHRKYTIAGTSGGGVFDSWEATLRHAGEQLRYFRASQDNPDAHYTPPRKTPEWEKVIWGTEDHFPLGALGLPVVFKKNGPSVNAEQNGEQLRRASPLWLRAVGCGDEWRLFSFAFLGEFLPGPNELTVFLRERDKRKKLRVDSDDISRLIRQWIDTLATDKSFFDIRRR